MWVTIDPSTIQADTAELSGPHRYQRKGTWLQYCIRCGHCPLRNAISELVHRIGCGFKSDQRYIAWVRRNWPRVRA